MNKMIKNVMYAIEISDMTDEELFEECMQELYGGLRMNNKEGLLVHELMERIEPNVKEKEASNDR